MALCFDSNQARVLVNTFLTARARSAQWTGFYACTLDALSRGSVMTIPTIMLCTATISRCAPTASVCYTRRSPPPPLLPPVLRKDNKASPLTQVRPRRTYTRHSSITAGRAGAAGHGYARVRAHRELHAPLSARLAPVCRRALHTPRSPPCEHVLLSRKGAL